MTGPLPALLRRRSDNALPVSAEAGHHGVVRRFIIPVEGLTIPEPWDVGPVRLRPAAEVLPELRTASGAAWRGDWFEEKVESASLTTFGDVGAENFDDAFDHVALAVDVLRVLQHVRHYTTQLTQFGISGGLPQTLIPYGVHEDGRAGYGTSLRGEAIGWTFPDTQEWRSAAAFRWAAEAIGTPQPTEAARRALIGLQLMSQALVEHRPALKMVQLVTALEAWLLPQKRGTHTYRLARAVAFFGCGRHNNDLCGRSRETCLYLGLDPGSRPDLGKLKKLRIAGEQPPWRCSEWHRVVDWYDLRSEVVHGRGPTIELREARNALFWAMRYLAEPILAFLSEHENDPIDALESEIAALPAMPDWEARLGPLT